MHIYTQGNKKHPKLVLMSGSGTIAPVYDFKVLYEKLAAHFRIIVIEKFGYGYSDIFESPCDIDSLVGMQRQALAALPKSSKTLRIFGVSNLRQAFSALGKLQEEEAATVDA